MGYDPNFDGCGVCGEAICAHARAAFAEWKQGVEDANRISQEYSRRYEKLESNVDFAMKVLEDYATAGPVMTIFVDRVKLALREGT